MPTYAKNKKAHFDYEILETYEAGLVLSGQEVKAAREGKMRLQGAFVTFHNNEAYIIGAHISPYTHAANIDTYDPERSRKLLLHKKEIAKLQGKSAEKGLTIVPISVYTSGRHIKVKIGVGRGKKKYDKRESIKKRQLDRDMRRQVKNYT